MQGRPLHGTPPLCQPQEAENKVGPVGQLPHDWFVFHDQHHILIESEGFYFFWHEPTDSLERIDRPKELLEILKQLDHGTLLPRKASTPAELNAPLIIMELIRAKNLLYWLTPGSPPEAIDH